ncbi:MAG: DNA-directed RNA polymerase subunit omega [Candidatus Omnitrophica bacterium]|nr:DNA-directed RNA polymerase subunit omega [Candidatus Omnitrophota bacterium]
MRQAPIDELLKQCSSIYKLVVITAKRARELNEGAPKLLHTDLKKVTSLAIEEVHRGAVLCKPVEGEDSEHPAKGEARTKARQPKPAAKKKG